MKKLSKGQFFDVLAAACSTHKHTSRPAALKSFEKDTGIVLQPANAENPIVAAIAAAGSGVSAPGIIASFELAWEHYLELLEAKAA